MNLYSKHNLNVLTEVKVASRMCEYWFGKPESKFDIHGLLENKNITLYYLYREPRKRFMSGVYQDFINKKLEKENILGERPFEWHRIPTNYNFNSSEKSIIETHLDKFLKENINDVFNTGHTHTYLKDFVYEYNFQWPKIQCKFILVDIGTHDVDKLFNNILTTPYYETSTDPLIHNVQRDKSNTVILQQFRNKWISDLVKQKIDKINYSEEIKQKLD